MKKIFLSFFIILASFCSSSAFAAVSGCDDGDMSKILICEFGLFINISVYFCYVIGTLMIILGALFMYLNAHTPGKYSVGAIIASFITAGLLLGFSQTITIIQSTTFGDSVYALTDYNEIVNRIHGFDGHTSFGYMSSGTIKAIFAFAKLVGVIAMIRSIYMIYSMGRWSDSSKGTIWEIIVLGVFGALCFRLEDTLCLLGNTLKIGWLCLV